MKTKNDTELGLPILATVVVVLFVTFIFSDNGIKKYISKKTAPYTQMAGIGNLQVVDTPIEQPALLATTTVVATKTEPMIAKVSERKGSYIEVRMVAGHTLVELVFPYVLVLVLNLKK